MNKQQPLLQINNLSLAYGAKEILKAVHLTVCPGEILGIVGSSGGGKSTLLKTLTGLLPANAVITGGEAPVPTSQIIYNQAILDGIQRSSDCGHEVEIEIPEV